MQTQARIPEPASALAPAPIPNSATIFMRITRHFIYGIHYILIFAYSLRATGQYGTFRSPHFAHSDDHVKCLHYTRIHNVHGSVAFYKGAEPSYAAKL